MTNRVATSDMRSLFDALGDDELEVKTHTFYSEVSDTEVGWLSRQVQLIGMEDSGQITFDDFKAFIEMKDVEESAGKQPITSWGASWVCASTRGSTRAR